MMSPKCCKSGKQLNISDQATKMAFWCCLILLILRLIYYIFYLRAGCCLWGASFLRIRHFQNYYYSLLAICQRYSLYCWFAQYFSIQLPLSMAFSYFRVMSLCFDYFVFCFSSESFNLSSVSLCLFSASLCLCPASVWCQPQSRPSSSCLPRCSCLFSVNCLSLPAFLLQSEAIQMFYFSCSLVGVWLIFLVLSDFSNTHLSKGELKLTLKIEGIWLPKTNAYLFLGVQMKECSTLFYFLSDNADTTFLCLGLASGLIYVFTRKQQLFCKLLTTDCGLFWVLVVLQRLYLRREEFLGLYFSLEGAFPSFLLMVNWIASMVQSICSRHLRSERTLVSLLECDLINKIQYRVSVINYWNNHSSNNDSLVRLSQPEFNSLAYQTKLCQDIMVFTEQSLKFDLFSFIRLLRCESLDWKQNQPLYIIFQQNKRLYTPLTYSAISYDELKSTSQPDRRHRSIIQARHTTHSPSLSRLPRGSLLESAHELIQSRGTTSLTKKAIASLKKTDLHRVVHPPNRGRFIEQPTWDSHWINHSESDSDDEYKLYRQLEHKKVCFYQRYHLQNKMPSLKDTTMPQTVVVPEDHLYDALMELVQDHSKIPQVEVQTLEDAFCKGYLQKLPVFVLKTDLNEQSKENLKNLLEKQNFTQQRLRNQFIYFGILGQTYELEPWLQVILGKMQNQIVITRINMLDEIEIITRINLNQQCQSISKQVKKAKAKCIQKDLDDKYLYRKHKMAMDGMYWKRPKSYKRKEEISLEQKRFLSDQKLRREQEREYRELQAEVQQSKNHSNQQNLQDLKEKRKKQREEKRKQLKVYDQGLMFKVRVPSGNNFTLKVAPSAKIQYLFDYIQVREEQLGYQDELSRKFDIWMGLGDAHTLSSSKEHQVGQIFDCDTLLIVKEIQ